MVQRWLIVCVMLFGLGLPRQTQALSCIPVADIIAKMDVIVRGKILAIPRAGTLELAVTQYLKGGDGSPSLTAAVPGIGVGQRMDWFAEPRVGNELIIGFVRQGDALENQPCHLFVELDHQKALPPEVQQLLAQAPAAATTQREPEPPPPQAEPGQPPSRRYLLPAAGVLVLGLATLVAWRWRRHL